MGKSAVIYWSGTGNTEIMANAIAKGMTEGGEAVEVFNVCDFKGSVSDYDKIAFGCPSMGNEVLEESDFEPFFEAVESALSGKKIALFGSYGWGDGQWMRDWEKRVNNDNANLFGEGLIINNTPDADGTTKCAEFGRSFAKY
jgi:flavodoxin I